MTKFETEQFTLISTPYHRTDVAFNKKRGLELSDMARSSWIYRSPSYFRAGIDRARVVPGPYDIRPYRYSGQRHTTMMGV
jgi:hypothetical protein